MAVNKNALIRYKTIDKCLKNKYRRWTLEDLIDACSDALYDFEGIDKGVSKRTVQADIQMMRSDKLGYNAPIIVKERKYYTYEDPDYSITNIPLTDQDMDTLTEVIEILKQFKGFSHFMELDGMVQKLEDSINVQKNQTPVIDFEKNENLKGLEHLDTLYQAILSKQVLTITYQSFKARKPGSMNVHPYLLKEFKNRWFVIGIKGPKQPILTLALDRIIDIKPCEDKIRYLPNTRLDAADYYKDVIGVTVNEGIRPTNVYILINHANAPYILTKPLHQSQELVKKVDEGVIIKIKVKLNFELEKELLGFGESITVLKPQQLRDRLVKRTQKAIANYTHFDDLLIEEQAD